MIIRNVSDDVVCLADLGLTIDPQDSIDLSGKGTAVLRLSDTLILNIANGKLAFTTEGTELSAASAVRMIMGLETRIGGLDQYNGRLAVSTSRKEAHTDVQNTGCGDDGELAVHHHQIGDPLRHTMEFVFHTMENPTYIWDASIGHLDARNDTFTCELIPSLAAYGEEAGTDLYRDPDSGKIIPVSGTGDVSITNLNVSLVEVPMLRCGNRAGSGCWDADYDTETQEFSNLRPASEGEGKGAFNLWHLQPVFYRYVRKIPLLGSGTYKLGSDAVQRYGHNLRLRAHFDTNPDIDDHEWWANASLFTYRKDTAT